MHLRTLLRIRLKLPEVHTLSNNYGVSRLKPSHIFLSSVSKMLREGMNQVMTEQEMKSNTGQARKTLQKLFNQVKSNVVSS